MTAINVEYEVSFGKGSGSPTGDSSAQSASKDKSAAVRTARLLALAHYVERCVKSGLLKDYAAAARILGMTRARMAQVMKLLMLSPLIQEKILLGEFAISERPLRSVLRHIDWMEQEAAVARLV